MFHFKLFLFTHMWNIDMYIYEFIINRVNFRINDNIRMKFIINASNILIEGRDFNITNIII